MLQFLRFFIIAVFIFFSAPLLALGPDNPSISGRIVDQEKNPVEFAAVTLLKSGDSSLVKGAMTGSDGTFNFSAIKPGSYLIAVTFAGFKKTWKGPFILEENQLMETGDILLEPVDMKEVEIHAIRPLYIRKPDKLIMDVENSPVRIIGTAWDILTTAPGVSVDQNNNITLRGKSGVKIYIDGKDTYLGGDQLQTYLQNIPATDVVQVEIITNPSAKYSAEGTGGILNIITRKGSQQGLNGNVRAGYGQGVYAKYEFGADANYAKEKFNVYGKYFFSNSNNLFRSYINRNVPYAGSTTNFNQHTTIKGVPFGNRASAGADFYAKKNITWGARIDFGISTEKDYTNNSTFISQEGNDTTLLLHQLNYRQERYRNSGANLYFRQQYDTNGREVSASFDFIQYAISGKDSFDISYYNNYGATSKELQKNKTATDITIFVGQADYSHPFGKKYKIETGIKSSYVETANELGFFILTGAVWENDTTRSNTFIYKEIINAGYVTGYADYGKFQLMGGLRVEQTIADGNSPTTGQRVKRSYTQLFPSVFVLHQLSKKHALNYSYSRRINRPEYNNLNPFMFFLDKFTFELGNPYLQPEIAHNAEITYSFMDAVFFTAGGSRIRYSMSDVSNQIDSTGIGYKTTVNLDNVDNLYFGLSSPVPVTKWFFAELELSAAYNRFVSELFGTTIDNRNWIFNTSVNFTLTLPKEWKFQAWGWYQSPALYGIWHMRSKGGVGGGLTKSFFNKQLTLSLNAFDIFQTTRTRATINFQSQDVYLEFLPESPRVFLRVRYAFGNKKATRKAETKSGADELKERTGK